jgi:hypothetical protein
VWRRRAVPAAAGAIVLLAAVETVVALVAPLTAPTTADWRAAEATVRAGFRPGDLIVAAPPWSDQVMRSHLGDLVPLDVIGRMDAARFGRIWEISQRGGRAPETRGARVAAQSDHGAVRVRRYERRAATPTFDFVASWSGARMTRAFGGGEPTPCPLAGDRFACPGGTEIGWSSAQPRTLEIDFALRRALYLAAASAPSSARATAAVEYPSVPLGRELAVGAGLHNAWWREVPGADGVVTVRVLVSGNEVGRVVCNNRSGWTVARLDTSPFAGKTVPVRFEIASDRPYGRHVGLAAEARNP